MFAKISGRPVKRNNSPLSLEELWKLVKNRQFKEALDILDASNHKVTGKHLYMRARCLAGLRQYSDAVTCLVRIENPSISHKRCLGFCYRSMGKHDKALHILYTIPRQLRDRDVLYDMARIYQEKGCYQKAIDFYYSIEGWEQDNGILDRLADCQQKMDLENADNVIKPVFSWEYIRGNNNPHTFFQYYNPDLRKGISAYAFEKGAFMHAHDSDLYRDLRQRYKNLSHIEELDLAEPDSRRPGMATLS
jgi:tetratricopeptide (TPR) repeat protein